ncbi:MAG: hypothetical protein AB1578_14445 [Thermodesulfobacteriota bacterium]
MSRKSSPVLHRAGGPEIAENRIYLDYNSSTPFVPLLHGAGHEGGRCRYPTKEEILAVLERLRTTV